jgi:MFS family permease
MPDQRSGTNPSHQSAASGFGLNAANFFQAEAVGVVMPVLNGYLRASGWAFSSIGIATAMAGLGTLLVQTPAGLLTDRIESRRRLFAITCIVVGVCFVLPPVAAHSFGGILALLFSPHESDVVTRLAA